MSDVRMKSVQELAVFRKAYAVSLTLHEVSLKFPPLEQRILADQIRRSSKSICANLAEGFARQRGSRAEFRRFVVMALGSSDETQLWLSYAKDLGYIAAEDFKEWRDAYQEISKMLQGLLRSLSEG